MNKRKVVLSALDRIKDLHDSDCKLLVRVDVFFIVGIITKIKRQYDSQVGRDRRWAIGVTLEGDIFEEPLDRKNPKTGRLEDVVQRETEHLVITARRSFDARDIDDNFNWLPHQFSLDDMKTYQDDVDVLRRTNNRLIEEISATKKHMQLLEVDAHNTAEQNNNFREAVRRMSSALNTLEMENQGLYTLLQRLRGHGLEVEGELSVELERALEKGKERAMDAHDLRMKKFKDDEAERQQINAIFPLSDIEGIKSTIESVVEGAVEKRVSALARQSQVQKQKPATTPVATEEAEET